MSKLKLLLIMVPAVLSINCKKSFFDINQNPNQVTADKISSELILPSALHLAGAATANFRFLNRWMGYWSYNPTFNLEPEEVTYNVTTTFPEFAAMWNGYYDALFDLHNVEEKAAGENVPFYAGIAKVMKARLFQDLVDAFGNVPYSEAFHTKEFATPKYDKGDVIYKDLLVVLHSAINIFKNKPVPSRASTVDIMYQGNEELWIRFANTIRLRCLIRQTQVS